MSGRKVMFSFNQLNRVAQNGVGVLLRNSGNPSKLGSSRAPTQPIAFISNTNLSAKHDPVKLFSGYRNPMVQGVPPEHRRCYSDLERKAKVEDSLDLSKRGLGDENRWFHPSPTEGMENPAYTYLKNHPEYQTMFFQHQVCSRLMTEDGRLTPVGEESVNPAVKAFIDLCNSNPSGVITDEEYAPVFSDLTSQCSKLSDVELLLVFYNLRRFPKKPRARDKDYRKIWMPLDDQCYLRFSERAWNLEYMFNLADLMYAAGLSMESKFHWVLVKKLYKRVDQLSREEFIRMMFCFGGVKSIPEALSLYNVEYNLPKFIDDMTAEEVAVVSVGFLRTKTYVSNKDVLKKMMAIVAKDATSIRPPCVSAVAKAINLSSDYTVREDVYNFLEAFVSQVERLDMHACASLLLLGMRIKVAHEPFMWEVVRKLEGKLNNIRSKDLEYICAALTTFNVDCETLYKEIVEDFQTKIINTPLKSFCLTHGRSFVNILHSLSIRNIYPKDLIAFALSDPFLDVTFGRSMYTYPNEVLLLDICIGLEAEGYDGPRLSEKYRQFLTKKNMLWIAAEEKNSSSEYQKIARYMLQVLTDTLGGPEYGHLCNVVPPFRTIGAVYCIDEKSGNHVPVPESFASIDDFNIKYIPESAKDKNIKFHAFVLFPGTHVAATTSKPIGVAEMHLRQMDKMGFQVHPLYLSYTVDSAEEMKQAISKVLGRPIPAHG